MFQDDVRADRGRANALATVRAHIDDVGTPSRRAQP